MRRWNRWRRIFLAVALLLFQGVVFGEARLLDVGLWYGRLSPEWTALESQEPYELVISRERAGNIGSTAAVGRDGTRIDVFRLTDLSGSEVYRVRMTPYSGDVIGLESFDRFDSVQISERLAYYRSQDIAPVLEYRTDGSLWLSLAGFSFSGEELLAKGISGGAELRTDSFLVSTWEGEPLALISAVNRDCMVASPKSSMTCSQNEKPTSYRGGFRYTLASSGRFALVNRLDIEEYLRGVVPGEVSALWPMECLKAQAVAARNYAASPSGKYVLYGFDVDDTTGSQVYYGMSIENPRSDQAIAETRGEYMLYDGALIYMFFNASSGGYLDSAKNIWGGEDLPYLIPKPDPYSLGYHWMYEMSPFFLSEIAAEVGQNIGEPAGIEILSRTPSGRVKRIRIFGTGGSFEISGEHFKGVVNSTRFKSTLFTFDPALAQNYLEEIRDGAGADGGVPGEISQPSAVKLSELVGPQVSVNPPSVVKRGNGYEYIQGNPNSGGQSDGAGLSGSEAPAPKESGGYRLLFEDSEIVYFYEGVIRFYGHGYGHGIGLSQLGALKMAELGKNYREILEFYYNQVESIRR